MASIRFLLPFDEVTQINCIADTVDFVVRHFVLELVLLIDLGVTVDMELKFEEQIASKVKTANAMMGLIRRSFSYLSCYLFRKLYLAFVPHHLMYAQAVWAPHSKKLISMIKM